MRWTDLPSPGDQCHLARAIHENLVLLATNEAQSGRCLENVIGIERMRDKDAKAKQTYGHSD